MAESDLVIGWKLNRQFDPLYWKPGAITGGHSLTDVVRVAGPSMANHMVIVAQSGSGKSFFLGRIIEEILLKTLSRVFIFDPNADFKKIGEIVGANSWREAAYDTNKRRGFLPDESSRELFEEKWNEVKKVVYSMTPLDLPYHQKLQIDWPNISIDILSDELDSSLQTEVKHCHGFVHAVSELSLLTEKNDRDDLASFLDISKELCVATRGRTQQEILFHLKDRFPAVDLGSEESALASTWLSRIIGAALPKSSSEKKQRIEELQQSAALHRSFVSDTTERFYFSTAYGVQQSGLLSEMAEEPGNTTDARLHVVDLPSIDDRRFYYLTVSTLLDLEWRRVRQNWQQALKNPTPEDRRVPTFIVVDEAHNLMPFHTDDPTERWLREKFRTIAAEGRKYGLFLILVSQRPDKLDTVVLSECENRAIMKLGSKAVLEKTVEILGLNDIQSTVMQKRLEYDIGRALIAGAWAPDAPQAVPLYAAARRTEEGGRNLRSEYWSQPIKVPTPEPTATSDAAADQATPAVVKSSIAPQQRKVILRPISVRPRPAPLGPKGQDTPKKPPA